MNKLKLIRDLGMLQPREASNYLKRYGIYECPYCKKHFKTMTSNVNKGGTTKCGSCSIRISKTTHNLSGHRLYEVWKGQVKRCVNKKHKSYKYYGDKGISRSKEFNDFAVWLEYVLSLPNAMKQGYSLDRIDNDGDYERENLRWASRATQARNTRKLQKNNTSGYRGVTKQRGRWAAKICVNYNTTHLGLYSTKFQAAQAYDNYIIKNNLEHTKNFKKAKELKWR